MRLSVKIPNERIKKFQELKDYDKEKLRLNLQLICLDYLEKELGKYYK